MTQAAFHCKYVRAICTLDRMYAAVLFTNCSQTKHTVLDIGRERLVAAVFDAKSEQWNILDKICPTF